MPKYYNPLCQQICGPSHREIWVTPGSLGPRQSTLQTASPYVQRFLQGWCSWPTDTQTRMKTDHSTRVTTNCIFCCALRCGIMITTDHHQVSRQFLFGIKFATHFTQYTVAHRNDTDVRRYNFDVRQPTLIIFERMVRRLYAIKMLVLFPISSN